MASLLSLPGVTTTTAHMGAYGAENYHNEPVKKAIQIASNYPGLDNDLGRRLSATDLLYCTPLQGRDALQSHVFPDAFVDQLLNVIKQWIARHEPQRFGHYMVWALSRPTTDASAWNHVFEEIEKSFAGSSRRPYIVDPDSNFGKEIQDLFRMDAVRIQVANTPSQRRFYSDFPHVARGAALQYVDSSRSIEVEQLDEVRQPKGRFSKPVQFAVFIYGTSRQASGEQQQPKDDPGPSVPVSGLPTDITFPGLGEKVPLEIRRSVARLHVNLGHPSSQELNRLLCHRGVPSSGVQECVRKLSCATCQRLSGPQQPRPSAVPSLQAGQFGDLVQGDFFWVRLSSGTNVQVLGLADTATGYHQAAILREKSARDAYDLLHTVWLRPYGLPVRLLLDPDPLFQGEFEELLSTINVQVEYCPAEAHWVIGTVERRNCVLRTILEKMINDHVVDDLDRLDHVLSAAVHALNSFVTVKGRSPYQAVYGRVPRIPGGLLTDEGSLAQSVMDPGLAAERARSEAIVHLATMNVDQGLRRAILRKTNNLKIEGLQPGQKIAFWRWRRRGLRKRGAWTTGRFLAYDPSQPGKQCWIRSGNSTILVTMEQVRLAAGWEDWCPDEDDIKCLKDATKDLRESVFQDQQGPPPAEGELPDKDDDIFDLESIPQTPTLAPASVVPFVIPPKGDSQQQQPQQQPQLQLPSLQTSKTDHYNLTLSPTFQQNTYVQSFGEPSRAANVAPRAPRTPGRARSRSPAVRPLQQGSPKPSALPPGASYDEALRSAAFDSAVFSDGLPEQQGEDQQQLQPTPAQPGDSEQDAANLQPPDAEPPASLPEQPTTTVTPPTSSVTGDQQQLQPTPAQPGPLPSSSSSTSRSLTEEVQSSQAASQPEPTAEETLPVLPQKRPFETLTTLLADAGELHRVLPGETFYTGVFGPLRRPFYDAYLASDHRAGDVPSDKNPLDSDTTDSDVDNTNKSEGKRLSRKELKQLDREIPWTAIMKGPHVQEYLKAVEKEAESWKQWNSVEPLTREQAAEILNSKILSKRILRSRACYRDKSRGQGPVRPKCRVVCLGHQDPDLFSLNRQAPTPCRTSEHVVFMILVAGSNRELGNKNIKWKGWLADASTAFLQGQQPQEERNQPLYMRPPTDGLIAQTQHWRAPLYLIKSNIYGLANAPRLWCVEVTTRLLKLDYSQHSFDKMLFLKRDAHGDLISVILVYVDDFLGAFREDYDIGEVHQAFTWGSLNYLETGKPQTFKGKELTLKLNSRGRNILLITQTEFIKGLDSGKMPKAADLEEPLTPALQAELRSVAGCLQWLCGQSRPELSPYVSLNSLNSKSNLGNLKSLYYALDFAKATAEHGLTLPDVPLNLATTLVSYSDASFANSPNDLKSQFGVLVLATTAHVTTTPCLGLLLDWRSGKSARVCRSTLAAEAMAADEAVDRLHYTNLFLTEILTGQLAHKAKPSLRMLHAVDAKSLYDSLIQESPQTSEKRTLVSIKSVQDSLDPNSIHWIPTELMRADGLTKLSSDLMSALHEWLKAPWVILRQVKKKIDQC